MNRRRSARLAKPEYNKKPTPPPGPPQKSRKYSKRASSTSGSTDDSSPPKQSRSTRLVTPEGPEQTVGEYVFGVLSGQISEDPEVVIRSSSFEKRKSTERVPPSEKTRRSCAKAGIDKVQEKPPEEVDKLLKEMVGATHGIYYTSHLPDLKPGENNDEDLVEVARWVKTNAKSLDKLNVAAEKLSYAARAGLPRDIQRVQKEADELEMYAQRLLHKQQKKANGEKIPKKRYDPVLHSTDTYGIYHLANRRDPDFADSEFETVEPPHNCQMVDFLRQSLLRMENQLKLQWETLDKYKKEMENKDKILETREKAIQDMAFRIRVAEGDSDDTPSYSSGGVQVVHSHFSVPYSQASVESGVKQQERLKSAMKICFPNSKPKDIKKLITDTFPEYFSLGKG
ncbi:unnamed protein product [Bursaphelenchus xylophilus]|uniref:(pine wood nematode) hypothetical protein n=1 Tax=Bursaphelenchus xylophilus TaxID=6326 RepID=A0A1I7RXG2_BURXY|nr:unnamed protein product [Bursaphelenchus xylophilus]CAG9126386.1 unnamed protein product [Bursaphelenchus xylophilus]